MILKLLQSSAYSALVEPGITTRGRSLINIMKNRGLDKELGGTPEQTLDQNEDAPLIT